MNEHSKVNVDELVRYLEGEVTNSEAEKIEDRLAGDTSGQKRLSELRRMTSNLKETDGDLEDIDFVPEVRAAIAAVSDNHHKDSAQKPWRLRTISVAACFAAIVGVSIFWFLGHEQNMDNSDQFRVKASGKISHKRDKWVGISAFHIGADNVPRSLNEQMHRDDALLLSYTNLGDEPFSFMMIFAVNNAGDIFWYYPAYLDERTDPTGIPIRQGVRNVELFEKIQHKLSPGPLNIYGLFTDQPLSVATIEELIGNSKEPENDLHIGRLPIEDSGQYLIKTSITP